MNLKILCANGLVFTTVSLEVTSPVAGTVDNSHVLAENPDNAIDAPQIELSNAALTPNVKSAFSLNLAGGDAPSNRSTFTVVIDAGSKTITLTGSSSLAAVAPAAASAAWLSSTTSTANPNRGASLQSSGRRLPRGERRPCCVVVHPLAPRPT